MSTAVGDEVALVERRPLSGLGVDLAAGRQDTVVGEGLPQQRSVTEARVVRNCLGIRGQNCRKEVAEREVDRRTVVECADGHSQQVVCSLGAFLDDHVEVVPVAPECPEAGDPAQPHRQEGLQHRGGEDFASFVRLLVLRQVQQIRPGLELD